jgi:2-oxoglutarate/2-oxoacid ferredoxin oxidoreductase subunit alpha
MEKRKKHVLKDDVSCVICGAAGQGIQTTERILPPLMKLSGYHVFACKEYMSRVRGGSNSTEIRVASKRVAAFVDRIDILVPLDKGAVPHLEKRISARTMIIGDKSKLATDRPMIDVPFSKIASEIGGSIYENIVAAGVITGLFRIDPETTSGYIRNYFGKKSEDVIDRNILAIRRGYEIGEEIAESGTISVALRKDNGVNGELLLEGAEALGFGAIAGGCNFISSYPMTPATGVFTFLAQHGDEFGIIAEQAEDEISAMNMMLGAWYAGARAMVSTSGGGFALMTEGVSLAGMIESPAVINLGQRPGPATGLPTRTEQGDLEHVLHAGHGEFPRVIYAPGTIHDAFHLMRRAFDMADKYQIPVFVLSDQFLVDSLHNVPPLDFSGVKVEHHFIETDNEYRRYRVTKTGVSPRGIPGLGKGFVCLDSDEHDEEGHITEDPEVRVAMVNKRLRKMESIRKETIPPELIGSRKYKTLVIGWGTTYGPIREVIEQTGNLDLAFLHFRQVFPVHGDAAKYMKRAERLIIVENNATSQFGRLLRAATGIEIKEKVLKYNGMPFSVEELARRFRGRRGRNG